MTLHAARLYELRLELARQLDRPSGDSGHGYDLVVPLTPSGRLDLRLWQADPAACRIRRFRPGEQDAIGRLARDASRRWRFDYSPAPMQEEPSFRFGDEHFALGEYVSIRESDGRFHHFRIISARPL
jgi:hypothetical protein